MEAPENAKDDWEGLQKRKIRPLIPRKPWWKFAAGIRKPRAQEIWKEQIHVENLAVETERRSRRAKAVSSKQFWVSNKAKQILAAILDEERHPWVWYGPS